MRHPSVVITVVLLVTLGIILSSSFADARQTKKQGEKGKNPHKAVPSQPKGEKLESKAVIEAGCVPIKAVNDLNPDFVSIWMDVSEYSDHIFQNY